ncbi:hypothetical protein M405DRAFT_886367 [Rhizopogon salebrosus TDB-379]|nr:hypothetical protein M405DRAFT_886367 [Rhizopogon salebrosus TDB-379]
MLKVNCIHLIMPGLMSWETSRARERSTAGWRISPVEGFRPRARAMSSTVQTVEPIAKDAPNGLEVAVALMSVSGAGCRWLWRELVMKMYWICSDKRGGSSGSGKLDITENEPGEVSMEAVGAANSIPGNVAHGAAFGAGRRGLHRVGLGVRLRGVGYGFEIFGS